MSQVDKFLSLAVQHKASDIHFSSGDRVFFRVDGDLVAINEQPMPAESLFKLLMEILSPLEKEKYTKSKNLDKRYECLDGENFRVNVFQTHRGIAAVFRVIPRHIPTIAELKLPKICETLTSLHKGLVLVTGPTGSGKSTTLAAMLNHINEIYSYHILTCEDPIEFVHTSKKSIVNQREVGNSCNSFADALKYALREDSDVILVGEMRDLETISLALTAAETGHLVFGTLHTRGAAPSIDRMIDSFPADQQAMIRTLLSNSLAAVISQTLLKRANGKGRVAAFEVMAVNYAISNLIREGKIFQIPSHIETARSDGMMLMENSIQELIDEGIVTEKEGAPKLDKIEGRPVQFAKSKEKVELATSISANPAGSPKPTPVNFNEVSKGSENFEDSDFSYILSMGIDHIAEPETDSKEESSIAKSHIPPPIPKLVKR